MTPVKKRGLFYLIIIFLLINIIIVNAHEEEIGERNLDNKLKKWSVNIVIFAAAIVVLLIFISIISKLKNENTKKLFFYIIAISIIVSSIFLAVSTIYLNIKSETKGPVHWHADYQIYNCGKKVELIDPEGMTNRIGTSTFHEHNDNRIHVEGVVVDYEDISLHKFFEFTGGELTDDSLVIETNEGTVKMKNGQLCNNNPGIVQVFIYKTYHGNNVLQEKITHFEDYVISPYPNVPPGDCIIIEYDVEKEKTSYICETYKVALEKGELIGS